MDKGKRAKVEEEEGSELDAELVQAIEKLQEVQDELERVGVDVCVFSFLLASSVVVVVAAALVYYLFFSVF